MKRLQKILNKFILFSTIIFLSNLWGAEGLNSNNFAKSPENFRSSKLYFYQNDLEGNNPNFPSEIINNQITLMISNEDKSYIEKSFYAFNDLSTNNQKVGFQSLLTPRRLTGLAYSFFVPGSGQIYLGHQTKGMIFAVSFFTSLVGAIVSQNNFIGNQERIQSLQFEYLNADRFTLADYYWKQMVSVHDEQKLHEKTRNIFTVATILIWSVNLVDYIFLSDDKGPIEFSSIQQSTHNNYNLVSISIPLR